MVTGFCPCTFADALPVPGALLVNALKLAWVETVDQGLLSPKCTICDHIMYVSVSRLRAACLTDWCGNLMQPFIGAQEHEDHEE